MIFSYNQEFIKDSATTGNHFYFIILPVRKYNKKVD